MKPIHVLKFTNPENVKGTLVASKASNYILTLSSLSTVTLSNQYACKR